MTSRLPYPTLHSGLTPEDLPYGYTAYQTVFDDGRGYAPVVVGSETDENGRLVIIVALSPGVYTRCTMVSAGWNLEQASELVLGAWAAVQAHEVLPCDAPQTGSAKGPDVGLNNREA